MPKINFLNSWLEIFLLIFVPKYNPINAGIVKNPLKYKSFNVPRPWYNNELYRVTPPIKYILEIKII